MLHNVIIPLAEAPEVNPAEKSWLFFADESGVGDQLIRRLRKAGATCRVARRGASFAAKGVDEFSLRPEAAEDWRELLEA